PNREHIRILIIRILFLSYKFTNRKDKIGEHDLIFFIRRKKKKLFVENKIEIIQGFKSNDKEFSTYLEILTYFPKEVSFLKRVKGVARR
ncbi:hypothetical protein P9Z26_31120, partial [Bacillus cereus]|nr:hypothetical protein [Bacillus cereus]MED2598566.1 hypothetical protein [Bacillus thuringiensis]MEB8597592.1 hypothetical protein [Bacillus cereus]MEB8616170.1 hypothetical protein [Bacillus cereus]MEB8622185.1 hypothetical protein [Bacillus cereus]